MNDLSHPPLARGTPAPGPCREASPPCGHRCNDCLDVFTGTQSEVERLRAELGHEEQENLRLWQELRAAMRQTLSSLAPGGRAAGPAHSEEFVRGWNQCVREIDRRVRELQKVF